MPNPFYVTPGSSPGTGFLHNLATHSPYFGPLYNLIGTGVHAAEGTLGQYGPAPTVFGRIGQAVFPNVGLNGNPQGPVDPSDPNNPLNNGGAGSFSLTSQNAPVPTDGPFYPQVTNTGPGNGINSPGYGGYAPPVNSAGTPNQLAANRESNFITGFQNLQSTASSPFYQNDMRGPETGGAAPAPRFGSSFSQPSSQLAAYQKAYPMGSTLADIISFNQKVSSGAIPSYQQFAGLPAYHPPVATSPIATMLQNLIPPKAGTTTTLHA